MFMLPPATLLLSAPLMPELCISESKDKISFSIIFHCKKTIWPLVYPDHQRDRSITFFLAHLKSRIFMQTSLMRNNSLYLRSYSSMTTISVSLCLSNSFSPSSPLSPIILMAKHTEMHDTMQESESIATGLHPKHIYGTSLQMVPQMNWL